MAVLQLSVTLISLVQVVRFFESPFKEVKVTGVSNGTLKIEVLCHGPCSHYKNYSTPYSNTSSIERRLLLINWDQLWNFEVSLTALESLLFIEIQWNGLFRVKMLSLTRGTF